jgi:hypothetical protein
MRDVNSGWLLRYMHANGASFFFVAVYMHIFRGMYYGSYKAPREVLWILGVVILLLMMATAFMGYVLPWGQMSFWGATVITGFFTAFPGRRADPAVLLGGFSVDNPTLNRFFSLHYLLPFMIAGVVILHVWALHVTGQTNPTGVEVKSKTDTVPFTPYATVKDAFAMSIFLIVFAYFIFFMPNYLGHAGQLHPGQSAGDAGAHRAGMVLPAVLRDPARHHLQHRPDRLQAWRRACHVRFDRGAVRAALARHVEGALGGLPALVQAVLLDLRGQRDLPGLARREACGRRLHDAGADRTLYYFAFFLVILPVLGLDRNAEASAQLDHRSRARQKGRQWRCCGSGCGITGNPRLSGARRKGTEDMKKLLASIVPAAMALVIGAGSAFAAGIPDQQAA